MDPQLPPSVQPSPVARGKTTPKRGVAKPPKPKTKTRKFDVSFDVSTPESIKQQLVLKEKRYQEHATRDEAIAPTENPDSLKRDLDHTENQSSAEGSIKRTKTVPGDITTGVPSTASGSSALTVIKPARRNVGGRPRIHPPKDQLPSKCILFLRKNYPVNQAIPADIWAKIFDFSPPDFLFQARQTNSLFRMVLRKESQWKGARQYTYGFDHPDPPPGLTEMQYADLLTGVGCQMKGCNERQARKVYWAFQRRWCAKCLKSNTTRDTDIADVLDNYPWFPDCIPKVTFDSWNRYCWVGDPSEKPDWAQNPGTHVRYSCLALMIFIRDADQFSAVGPNGEGKTKEEKEAWVANRVEANRVLVEKLRQIEAYVETEKQKKRSQAGSIKAAREAFFIEKALQLDPPLSVKALEMVPKYKASIEIPKLPTERSWQELLPKLQEARAKAEKMIRKKEKMDDAKERMCMEYKKLSEDRKQNTTAEQRFVLELAEKEIDAVNAMVEDNQVAHVDFIPFVFRRVFEEYIHKHETSKPGNYHGRPYRLVLDDARMIYDCLIAEAIDRWNDHAKIRAAKNLKCPGCKRKDSHRLHEFEALIRHIGEKHADKVGPLSYFRFQVLTTDPDKRVPDYEGVPWCRLKWPRNLPILASHREVVGEWDPDDQSDYIHAPSVIPRNLSRDAFAGRCVENGEAPPRGDFIKNVIHAASLFDGMPISAKSKTQIVFKYALDRHNNAFKDFGAEPTVQVQALRDLPTSLIRAGVRGLFEGLHCKACCVNDTREKRHNKFADKKQSLGELIKHYLATHEHCSWTLNLFDLPSAEELWEELMKPGMAQTYQIFDDLFPEAEQVTDSPTGSSKAASLDQNLDQTTHLSGSLHPLEQPIVPVWRDTLWTASSLG
ncbi:hypothetical protein MMC07_006296 [Pseudocyphellaria aurata]|nr:hypothetical protein [Pseudocyphellaria aurata]